MSEQPEPRRKDPDWRTPAYRAERMTWDGGDVEVTAAPEPPDPDEDE